MIPQLLQTAAQAYLNRPLTAKGKQVASQVGQKLQQDFQKAQQQAEQQKLQSQAKKMGPIQKTPEEIMAINDESELDRMLSSFFPKASAEENPFTAASQALQLSSDNPFEQASQEMQMEENTGNMLSGLRDFQSNYQPEKGFFEKAGDAALDFLGGVGKGLNEAATPIAEGLGKLIGREPASVEQTSIRMDGSQIPNNLASGIGQGVGTAASLIPAFISGGAAATGARGLATKALPVLEKSGTIGKSILGAVEGAGAALGFNAEQAAQNLTTEGATSGVGASAAIGAALPWAGGLIRAGQKFLGKTIPERIYKGAIKLTPTQKKKIAEIAGENAEEFLIRNNITGSADEIASRLDEIATASRGQKLAQLSEAKGVFKNDKALQLADDVLKNLEGAPGLEEEYKLAKEIRKALKGKGASLAEIDELKTLWDRRGTKVVFGGNARDTARAAGLKKLRGGVQDLIEKEAEKLGIPNIRDLNKTTQIAKEIGKAITERGKAAGGNAPFSLADIVLGGAVGSTSYSKDQGFQDSVVNALLAVGAKKFITNPAVATKFATFMAKMNPDKANKFFLFLQGERAGLNKKQAEEFKKIVENVSIKKAP